MRLWSLNPKYLDTQGLLAVWREALLAQQVLRGQTIGYKNHPQLARFKDSTDPEAAIGSYLQGIWDEAKVRGYRFAESKIGSRRDVSCIKVTTGQIAYEFNWLGEKLQQRDPTAFNRLLGLSPIEVHPLFTVIPGPVAKWERAKPIIFS